MHEPALNGRERSARPVNPREDILCFPLDGIGQRLDGVRARNRVDGIRHSAFCGEDLLRAQSDPCRIFCW
ncbi:hypothetical protein D3C83_245270 [compost metagenome]